MADLKSRSLICRQSTDSKSRKSVSPAVCDISTGYMEYDTTGIQKLNDDCLMQIFTYIPRGDLLILEKVCKRWEMISWRTWRSLKNFDFEEKTWGNNNTYDNLRQLDIITLQKVLLRCGSFLTHIRFTGKRIKNRQVLSGKLVAVFAKYCKNLQCIDIENCVTEEIDYDPIYEIELSELFLNNKKLHYVRLAYNAIIGKCLLYLPADSIEIFILDGCYHMSLCHLGDTVKKFKKLRILSLSPCRALGDGYLINNVQSSVELLFFGLINLEILNLQFNLYLSNEALKVIGAHCKKLKAINLSNCDEISNEGLAYIISLPKLKYLNISHIWEVTDEILTDIPNLRELNCSFNSEVKNQGLCQLIKKSHNLELLDVSGCMRVSNELVEVAIEATKNRTNNVILEMYVFDTAINVDHITTMASPFLQLINDKHSG